MSLRLYLAKLTAFDRVLVALSTLGAALIFQWMWHAFTKSMIDVDIYQYGGRALLEGSPLYALETQLYGLPYLYTPFAALLFAPLTALNLVQLHAIWQMASLTALALLVWFSLKHFAPQQHKKRPFLLTAGIFGVALLLEPIRSNLGYGQINIVLAALVIADLTRPPSKRFPKGALIGIAGAVKLTPLLFAVYLIGVRRTREGVTALVVAAGCSIIGFAVAFNSSVDFWLRAAYDTSRVGVGYVNNQSINGVWTRIFEGTEQVPLSAKLATLAMGGIVFLLALAYGRSGKSRAGEVLCGTTIVLMTPIAWSHHWVWVIPTLLWLGLSAPWRWTKPAAVASMLIFVIGPFNRLPKGMEREYMYGPIEQLIGASYTLLALALAAALAIQFVRHRRSLPDDTMASTVSQLDGRGIYVEEGRGSTGQGAG